MAVLVDVKVSTLGRLSRGRDGAHTAPHWLVVQLTPACLTSDPRVCSDDRNRAVPDEMQWTRQALRLIRLLTSPSDEHYSRQMTQSAS